MLKEVREQVQRPFGEGTETHIYWECDGIFCLDGCHECESFKRCKICGEAYCDEQGQECNCEDEDYEA